MLNSLTGFFIYGSLIAIAILPFLAGFFPPKYLGRLFRWWLLPVIFLYFLISTESGNNGFGWALGVMVVNSLIFFMSFVWLLVKYIVARKGRKGIIIDPAPQSKFQLFCFGVIFAIIFFYHISHKLSELSSWLSGYLLLTMWILLFAVSIHMSFRYLLSDIISRNTTRVLLTGFISCCTLFMVANVLLPLFVINSAQEIAKGRPYCIQIPNSQIDSIMDLSLPRMLSGRNRFMYYDRHALLTVYEDGEIKLFHWSHNNIKFVHSRYLYDSNAGSFIINCSPDKDFIKNTPLFFNDRNTKKVVIGKDIYNIPNNYYPKITDSNQSLRIVVNIAESKPINKDISNLPYIEYNKNIVTLRRENDISKSSIQRRYKIEKLIPSDNKYGLYSYIDKHNNNNNYVYQQLDKQGNVKTLITSWNGKYYRHYFWHDGLVYNFEHPEPKLEKWQHYQNSVIQMVDSLKQ